MPGPYGLTVDELYKLLWGIYTSAGEPQEGQTGQTSTANFSQNLMIRLGTLLRDAMAAALQWDKGVIDPTKVPATLQSLARDAQNHFNALSTQIAGGSGNDPIVESALTAIAATLAQLVNQTAAHPADADASQISDVNATLFDAASKAEEAQRPVSDAFTFDNPQLAAAVDGAFAGQGGQWIRLLPLAWRALLPALRVSWPILAVTLYEEAKEHFPKLAALFDGGGQVLAKGFADGLTALHKPMESVVETSALAILRGLDDELFQFGQTTPENVDQAASRLLAIAGGFGMASHLVAISSEKIMGSKQLGFPQLAAYLADAASFGSIARNTIGAQVEAALHAPARRRALAQFRSELPDAGSLTESFFARVIDQETFRQWFREHGWDDQAIANHQVSVYRKATAREMALVFEDGEVDEQWALGMLQRHGFNDDDSNRLVKGVITRGTKTLRQEFITAVLANADEGIYSSDQAAGYLRGIGVAEPAVSSHLTAVAHKRLHREVVERTAALISAHTTGAYTDEELDANLSALGMDDRARAHHLTVARIRRGGKVFTQAQSKDQAAENRVRKEATNAALDAFRRFVIDEGGLHETLTALGVDPKEVDSLVQLAAVRRTPAPRLAEVLAPGAVLAQDQALERKRVLALQHDKIITQAEAQAQLVALGLDDATAASEAGLEAARIARPPDVVKATSLTTQARERTRELTTAAVDLFRAGLTDTSTLRGALVAAGHDAATADALVARTVDQVAGDRARAARRTADTEIRKEQIRIESEAVDAFRAGTIDAAGLQQTLVGAGFTSTVAVATVQREEQLRTSREERKATTAASSEATRVLRADQEAAVLAFRTGKLTADELEQQLVTVGTDPALAAALRRREEARKKPTRAAAALATAPVA